MKTRSIISVVIISLFILSCKSISNTKVQTEEINVKASNKISEKNFNDSFFKLLKDDDPSISLTFLKLTDPNKKVYNSPMLVWAALRKSFNTLKVLIELGADVNATNDAGFTALSMAFSRQDMLSANYLLSKGAIFDEKQAGKQLFNAINKADIEKLNFLAKAGVNLNVEHTNYSFTHQPLFKYLPLKIAQNIQVFEQLLALGAKPNIIVNGLPLIYHTLSDKDTKKLELLIKYKVKLNKKFGSNTPLHFATYLGNYEAVNVLISNGARKHTLDSNLQRPIDIAIEKGFVKIEGLLSN